MTRQEKFETPGPVEVMVENKLGEVRLRAHSAPVTEVELRREGSDDDEVVENARVELHHSGGNQRVIVEVSKPHAFLWQRGSDVIVTVHLPEGASVDVETAAGKVIGEGTLGGARVRTASGSISLGPVVGDLVAKSASGDVTVASVTGGAEIETASGSVRCGPLGQAVLVKTASGAVDVESAGARMTTQTASGDISVGQLNDGCDLKTVSGDQRVRQLTAGQAEFKTVSGDLTISVARGTAVAIEAEALSGSLSSEIELSPEVPSGEEPGQQDGPHAELRIRTVSGNVRIRRAPV